MLTRILLIALLISLIIIVLLALALRLEVTPSCDSECRDIRQMNRVLNLNTHCLANGGYMWSCWKTAERIVLGG